MNSNSISVIYDTIESPDVKPNFKADIEAGPGRPQGLMRSGLRQGKGQTVHQGPDGIGGQAIFYGSVTVPNRSKKS